MTDINLTTITPKQNTFQYEPAEDGGGMWAYLKEIPTTRVWGKDRDEACLRLMCLVLNVQI